MDPYCDSEMQPLLHQVMSRAAENLVPLQAALEITYRCNLRCRHCYVDAPYGDELSLQEWHNVIDQLRSAGCLYLLITGGEPLVRKDFLDIAHYARRQGFILMLLTNGTLITPRIAEEISWLRPLFVGMSVYGVTSRTHDHITGRPGSLLETLRGIDLLQQRRIPVKLQAVLMSDNVHEASEIQKLADTMNIAVEFSYDLAPTKSGESHPRDHRLTPAQLHEYYDADWMVPKDDSPESTGICKAGRATCSVAPNGDVFPCIMMPLKLGNLRQQSFADIWSGSSIPELTLLRRLEESDFHQCNDCDLRENCNRCTGRNLTETGELTKPAPSACQNAAIRSEILARREVRHEEDVREAEDGDRDGAAADSGRLRQSSRW